MTSPNSPGRDGDPDGRAMEGRLRIWTEYHGLCVVVGVAGEIDIATADRLRLQVIIAVLAAISPPLVIDLGGWSSATHPGEANRRRVREVTAGGFGARGSGAAGRSAAVAGCGSA